MFGIRSKRTLYWTNWSLVTTLGFVGFDEIHFTKHKYLVDVDVLIDDSPEKLQDFNEKSVMGGVPICMKQTWNTECHTKYMSIDRLSDIIKKIHD